MVVVSTVGWEEHASLMVEVFHVRSKGTGSDPRPTQPNLQAFFSSESVSPSLLLNEVSGVAVNQVG